MRILLLTILFFAPIYYFTRSETPETPTSEKIDSVKLKMGAPDRHERELTVDKKQVRAPAVVETPKEEVTEVSQNDVIEENAHDFQQAHWTDLEEGWNNELKDMLLRLEPADGEEIFQRYTKELEAYQAELDALMNEKQQKETDEEALEVDQMIVQLDAKHQDRLKEILGAHYDAVRDQYQLYMDSAEE